LLLLLLLHNVKKKRWMERASATAVQKLNKEQEEEK
jgi:hypothetical protein